MATVFGRKKRNELDLPHDDIKFALRYIRKALLHSGYDLKQEVTGMQLVAALEKYDEVEPVSQAKADVISAFVIRVYKGKEENS